jgi:hypothetical protein
VSNWIDAIFPTRGDQVILVVDGSDAMGCRIDTNDVWMNLVKVRSGCSRFLTCYMHQPFHVTSTMVLYHRGGECSTSGEVRGLLISQGTRVMVLAIQHNMRCYENIGNALRTLKQLLTHDFNQKA